MSEEQTGNTNQGTESYAALEAAIAAEEAARHAEPEASESDSAAAAEPAAEAAEPEPETAEPPSEEDQRKRMAELHYERRAAEKREREARHRLEQLEGKQPPPSRDEEVVRLAKQMAEREVLVRSYNERVNSIFKKGTEEFPEFAQELSKLREIGVISPDNLDSADGQRTRSLVEAAEEVGDSHKLFHWMSQNPDEAERIAHMSPARMGVALAKVASKLAAPPPRPTSKAPPPIRPLNGAAKAEKAIDEMSMEEFAKLHDETWYNRRVRR